jgi:succinate dehydrogenase/fumarate reductase flavoprotein subunit
MGGLTAAAEARARGANAAVLEKGERPGGSMLLSSGFVWRFRDFDRFREECPTGDPALQRLVWERLDDDVLWLESLGVRVLSRDTGNPETTGVRFDTESLTDVLVRRAGDVRLREPLEKLPRELPVVLATGGFHASRELVAEHITEEPLMRRGNPWSTGDGLMLALEEGAAMSQGMDEFYGRAMPWTTGEVPPSGWRPLAQLYARHASRIESLDGEVFDGELSWHEVEVVQWMARRPEARATFHVMDDKLGERVRGRSVREMVDAARDAGAPVERAGPELLVPVVAGITSTLGGLRIDETARAAEGLFACGTDAGGLHTGGYASGLAAALVLGRIAAESALEIAG